MTNVLIVRRTPAGCCFASTLAGVFFFSRDNQITTEQRESDEQPCISFDDDQSNTDNEKEKHQELNEGNNGILIKCDRARRYDAPPPEVVGETATGWSAPRRRDIRPFDYILSARRSETE